MGSHSSACEEESDEGDREAPEEAAAPHNSDNNNTTTVSTTASDRNRSAQSHMQVWGTTGGKEAEARMLGSTELLQERHREGGLQCQQGSKGSEQLWGH